MGFGCLEREGNGIRLVSRHRKDRVTPHCCIATASGFPRSILFYSTANLEISEFRSSSPCQANLILPRHPSSSDPNSSSSSFAWLSLNLSLSGTKSVSFCHLQAKRGKRVFFLFLLFLLPEGSPCSNHISGEGGGGRAIVIPQLSLSQRKGGETEERKLKWRRKRKRIEQDTL